MQVVLYNGHKTAAAVVVAVWPGRKNESTELLHITPSWV